MKKETRQVFKSFTMVSQIGISMLAPIFMCVFIGYYLDKRFSTGFWFILFLLLGIGAAFRNVYILTKPFYEKDMEKEHEQLKYVQDLKDYSKNHPEGEDEEDEW